MNQTPPKLVMLTTDEYMNLLNGHVINKDVNNVGVQIPEIPEMEQNIQYKEKSVEEPVEEDLKIDLENHDNESKLTKYKRLLKKTVKLGHVIGGLCIFLGFTFSLFTFVYNGTILHDVQEIGGTIDAKLESIAEERRYVLQRVTNLEKETKELKQQLGKIEATMANQQTKIRFNSDDIRILNKTMHSGSASTRNIMVFSSVAIIPIVLF